MFRDPDEGKANLHPVRPFAHLAINSLKPIRQELTEVEKEVAPMLQRDASQAGNIASQFRAAADKAILALESYRAWLEHLS